MRETSTVDKRDSQGLGKAISAARDGYLARLSLEHKLPLIIGVLLLTTILALSVASYAEVRRTALVGASVRLAAITKQFRDLFQQSAIQIRAAASTSAKERAIVDYTKSKRRRVAALAALQYKGPNPDQVIASQIRTSTGAVLLSSSPSSAGVDTLSIRDVVSRLAGDSAAIGHFRVLHDTIVYAVAAPIGKTGSYLVRWRRLAGSRRSREQITQLIGSDASLFLGSTVARVWTDLEHIVSAPPVDASSTQAVQSYARGKDGARYLAAGAPITGAPWMVVVDFPMANVMAPVRNFINRIALIAALALALSLGAAWFVSRRLTRPLVELTNAAAAITAGDYSHHPTINRSDELGRLGHSFGVMAAEVQHARQALEVKVAERTRELHEAMRQLKDAQDTNVRKEKLAILGQLSSGVGHELRNPLGVMTNAVYFLKMVLAPTPPKVGEYLDILQQQITLSEKIVGDLLDFARQKPPQRHATSVAAFTQAQLQRLGATNGVEIESHVPAAIPNVLVDQVQIGQIVLNLLTNAIQAMDGKGRIAIRAREAGDRVELEVADNGPGISPENIAKVFEPLFTTKARGIGLGLAVSRTLARANQGDLTVVSKPGQGATFQLTLPIAREGRV